MNKNFVIAGVVVAAVIVGVIAFNQSGPESSTEVIQQAQTFDTFEKQGDYLVKQAQRFVNTKNYDEAIRTAQHLLSNIDTNSPQAEQFKNKAKQVLANAKDQLAKQAKEAAGKVGAAAEDAKQQLGF